MILEFLCLEQNILCWSTSPHIWEWVLFVMVPSIWILIKIPYFFTRFRSICSCSIYHSSYNTTTLIHCMIVFLWNHGQYLHIMLRIFQDVCPFSPGFIFENCALHFFACTQDYVGHKSTFFFSWSSYTKQTEHFKGYKTLSILCLVSLDMKFLFLSRPSSIPWINFSKIQKVIKVFFVVNLRVNRRTGLGIGQ